jgi:hypothetical protein
MIARAIPPVAICREVSTGILIDSPFTGTKNRNTSDYNGTAAQKFRKFWDRGCSQKVFTKN